MLNHVELLGRLAQEPEIRYTQSGTAVASFDLAVQVPSKNKDAAPDYIPIVCWRERAEFCGRYLSKGRQIVVEGRISTRKWKDEKTGQNRKAVEVVASNIYFADSNGGNANGILSPPTTTDSWTYRTTDSFLLTNNTDRRTTAGQTGEHTETSRKATVKGGAHSGMDPSPPTT